MKEKLIELLGLKENATDEQIIEVATNLKTEVANLRAEVAAKVKDTELEKAVQAKIRESGGALNREQALETITAQKLHNAKADKAKK